MAALPPTYPLLKRLDWVNTLFLIITPLVVLTWTPLHIYLYGLEWKVLAFFFIYSVITSLSITGGYHRLIAHRAYQVRPWVKLMYLFFGAAAFQGSALKWCSAHRDHHRYVDTEDDPYTITKGFWHAHIGWVFLKDDPNNPLKFAPDLLKDPWMVWQHKYYFPISFFFGFGLPLLIGWMMGSPLGGLLYAGFVRAVFTQHCTFFINSVCHFWGSQPYTRKNTARDNMLMAIFTYGEGYHNFHHKFQADYRNGIRWYHWDPTKWLIQLMALFKQASHLKQVSAEEILKARLLRDEEILREKGLSPDTLAAFRLKVEEAQRRFYQLKADYKTFKKTKRDQFEQYLQAQRDSWEPQKQALRDQVIEAKFQFRMAMAQWKRLKAMA
ncbi:MAG TPA: fatty acid desaturase [Bdellovibrionales bacterium]|nr:fatty acid desaturase [Bdellovibrionales bacterium]